MKRINAAVAFLVTFWLLITPAISVLAAPDTPLPPQPIPPPQPVNNAPYTPSKPSGPTNILLDNSCFLPGTKVSMADGSYKNIKKVRIGDLVKSYHNGQFVVGEVVNVYKHTPNEMPPYYLIINNRLRVTPNHLIYVNNQWMPAGLIKIGDILLGENGEAIIVYSIDEVWEKVPTYNLEIKEYHTFFADGVLVHNAKAYPSYMYTTSTTDPDGDRVCYYFDWGDGSYTLTGYFDSGATASAFHS